MSVDRRREKHASSGLTLILSALQMPQTTQNATQDNPADRLIRRFGVPRLAAAMRRSASIVRRMPRPRSVGGQDGLLNIRQQIAVIDMVIEAGEPLDLTELYPAEIIERLKASNERIAASAEEAA